MSRRQAGNQVLDLGKQQRLDRGVVHVRLRDLFAETVDGLQSRVHLGLAALLLLLTLLRGLPVLLGHLLLSAVAGDFHRVRFGELHAVDLLAQIRELGQCINAGQRLRECERDLGPLGVKHPQRLLEVARVDGADELHRLLELLPAHAVLLEGLADVAGLLLGLLDAAG